MSDPANKKLSDALVVEAYDRQMRGEKVTAICDWLLTEKGINISRPSLYQRLEVERERRATAGRLANAASQNELLAQAYTRALLQKQVNGETPETLDLIELRTAALLQRSEEVWASIPKSKRYTAQMYLKLEQMLLTAIGLKLKAAVLGNLEAKEEFADIDTILNAKLGQLKQRYLTEEERKAALAQPDPPEGGNVSMGPETDDE